MFCNQCEETAGSTGCRISGVCGKSDDVAVLQDRLIYALKGYAFCNQKGRGTGKNDTDFGPFVMEALFSTLTNVNFDADYLTAMITETIKRRDSVRSLVCSHSPAECPAPQPAKITFDELMQKNFDEIGVLHTQNEDVRSLRETLIYGVKGIAAYGYHAKALNFEDENIFIFMEKALVSTMDDSLSADQLVGLLMECG
jgi:hydroxylamine reductase